MTFGRRFWLHELPLLKLSNKSPKVTKNLNPSSITKRQDQSTKEADFNLLFWACDSPSLCKQTEKDQIADANTTVNIVIVYIGIHSLIFSSLHIGDSSKVRPDHLLTWHTETLFKDLWSTRILYLLSLWRPFRLQVQTLQKMTEESWMGRTSSPELETKWNKPNILLRPES